MKKALTVIVFGTFDGIHDGHRFFLREAKKYGDRLIAVVARDEVVKTIKKHLPEYSLETRLRNLVKEKLVDDAVSGDKKIGTWEIIEKLEPKVVCVGYDQVKFKTELEKKLALFGSKIPKPKIVVIKPFKPRELHSSLIKKSAHVSGQR